MTATDTNTQTFSLVELYTETVHIDDITPDLLGDFHEILANLNKSNPGSLYVLREN